MTSFLKITALPSFLMMDAGLFNTSCACPPPSLKFEDLSAIVMAATFAWARALHTYLPSAHDMILMMALYHAYILIRVRPLDPYSRAYNKLLYESRLTVALNTALAFYHLLLRWPVATLIALASEGGSAWALPSRLARAVATAAPAGSAYLPVPSVLFALAVNVLTIVVAASIMTLYPVDGIPIDTSIWEYKPKPQCLEASHVDSHMGMTVVLRLRAQGIEPEYWRLGSRSSSPELRAEAEALAKRQSEAGYM